MTQQEALEVLKAFSDGQACNIERSLSTYGGERWSAHTWLDHDKCLTSGTQDTIEQAVGEALIKLGMARVERGAAKNAEEAKKAEEAGEDGDE